MQGWHPSSRPRSWMDGQPCTGESMLLVPTQCPIRRDRKRRVSPSPFVDAVNNAVAVTSSIILTGDSLDNGEDDQEPSNMPSSFIVGRTSEVVLDILDEGFQRLHDEISEISIQSSLPLQQVTDCFIRNYAWLNGGNHWNEYQIYFAQHMQVELTRLYRPNATVTGTPCDSFFDLHIRKRLCWSCLTAARIWRQCYDLFWGAYPDTWKDILEKSQELNDCVDAGKTVAQRQQLFNKNVRKLTQTVSIHIFCSRATRL